MVSKENCVSTFLSWSDCCPRSRRTVKILVFLFYIFRTTTTVHTAAAFICSSILFLFLWCWPLTGSKASGWKKWDTCNKKRKNERRLNRATASCLSVCLCCCCSGRTRTKTAAAAVCRVAASKYLFVALVLLGAPTIINDLGLHCGRQARGRGTRRWLPRKGRPRWRWRRRRPPLGVCHGECYRKKHRVSDIIITTKTLGYLLADRSVWGSSGQPQNLAYTYKIRCGSNPC